MKELKLCPFCGSNAEYDKEEKFNHRGDLYISHFVWCPYPQGGCGARIYGNSKNEAIDLWNTRK